ncbi:competence/damage-inducible protein A [Myxococcota bacterium]|nr:competence/damage-inducible protein A [Myxococcota bacterium]MBU1433177.1 competence/damage-inducible protein A [Myxococcota bacterium]MBU1896198.1 competence/damage-inducible protein A [Myxococcota bacterium]
MIAAIVLIGDELLSGKVQDVNARYLIERLRALGVDLRRVLILPDDVPTLAEEIPRLAAQVDVVFTSGGVGPTHDDVTMEGIAAGFGAPLFQHPELEALLRARRGDQLREAHLRMARVPEGTTLIPGGVIRWPTTLFRNVYIFPGIPELLRAKFEAIAPRLQGARIYADAIELEADEGAIAPLLEATQDDFNVAIGSYPRFSEGAGLWVRITVESRDEAAVAAAIAHLRDALPSATRSPPEG